MDSPKRWLPDDAIDPARFAPSLDAILAEWSRNWFTSEVATASATFQDDWPSAGAMMPWRSVVDVAAVVLTPNVQTAIASAMLGCTVPLGAIQPNDRSVLQSLSATAIDDLLQRLGAAANGEDDRSNPVGEPTDLPDSQTWDVSFRSGKCAFKLALARDAQIAIVKQCLPRPAVPKLTKIHAGLSEQTIHLVADLGRSSLALSDFEDLGVGDVLVLDRTAKDRVNLLIDGSASPFGGRVERVDGQTRILLESFKDHRDA